jgi:hypothetical protein
MAELAEKYATRLGHLTDAPDLPYVHTSRLRERILDYFKDMETIKSGKEYILATKENVGKVFLARVENLYYEALCLSKAAKIIRKEIMSSKAVFDFQFKSGLEFSGSSKSLSSLLDMILHGTSMKKSTGNGISKTAQCLSQYIQFNTQTSTKERKEGVRHIKDREPPLPVYLGLMIHSRTRSKELIEKLYGFSLSIFYYRVLEISSEL